jgi:hypothetical protein
MHALFPWNSTKSGSWVARAHQHTLAAPQLLEDFGYLYVLCKFCGDAKDAAGRTTPRFFDSSTSLFFEDDLLVPGGHH